MGYANTRGHARGEIVEGMHEYREERRSQWENIGKLREAFGEKAGVPTKEGLHTPKSLKEALANRPDLLELWDFSGFRVENKPGVTGFGGESIALQVSARNERTREREHGWIYLQMNADQTANYKCTLNREVIETVRLPSEFNMEWMQEYSRTHKVVKSRPKWMYPELLGVSHEEVWPKDAKIAVIGDPYQSCDGEGITIMEYEYAEEIQPPVLRGVLTRDEALKSKVDWFYEDLFHEDIRALENMYGYATPYHANPYALHFKNCIDFIGRVSQSLAKDESIEEYRAEFKNIKRLTEGLTKGLWTKQDGEQICGKLLAEAEEEHDEVRREKILNDLETWFILKQNAVESYEHGKPAEKILVESWEKFKVKFLQYFREMPREMLQGKIEGFNDKYAQALYWCRELPKTASMERARMGIEYLEGFISDVYPYYDERDPKTHILREPDILNFNDPEFGLGLPTSVVSGRVKRILNEGLLRAEQIMQYADGILPLLKSESERIDSLNIPIDDATRHAYIKGLESAWVKQHFFRKRTQRAVPVHGFFPYKTGGMEPQDRIVALTSVTMHGWNDLDEAGFRKDLTTALPYLKLHGKYILGPVNQHVYFGGQSNFKADELTKVLQDLKAQGVIEYKFVKGLRSDNGGGGSNFDAYDDEEERKAGWDSDDQVLHQDEAAHSLVITRIKA